ncbi:MAG TPA: Rieske 2Fe-2S domain-containing protein [Aggregatilineaceae bacterium]|nr:Rieske 2Fe-2S domain-containing protein [Aggregatilineaceae bacterium]
MFAQKLTEIPGLKENSIKVAGALHQVVINNETLRDVSDVLHGTWLGHPLHPVLTDVTIGAWTMGMVFDAISLLTRSEEIAEGADLLNAIGTAAAVPTALTGTADYSGIKRDAAAHGAMHALLNGGALTTYIVSTALRRTDKRGLGRLFSAIGMALTTLSAYIGGEMVYRKRVGVNHAEGGSKPEYWTPVMTDENLPEHTPVRVEVEGQPVLLYRYGGSVYAIGAVCSHAGGPLEEGQFDGFCVQCPWHDSVFDLRTGEVVHGPATFNEPHYRTRILNGQIEIRTETGMGEQVQTTPQPMEKVEA